MAVALATWDSTLDVGQTVMDAALGVSFATLSSSIDGALVRVTFGSAASLAPGASVSTTLSLVSPGSASGSYSFNASAADGTSGLSASAAGSASITAAPVSPTVTISAAVSKTGNNRSATLTVGVKSGSLPLAGATVTVIVTSPTGGTSTLSATTNSSGVATAKHSLKPKDPSGTYTAQAVSASGVTGSATTSFVMP